MTTSDHDFRFPLTTSVDAVRVAGPIMQAKPGVSKGIDRQGEWYEQRTRKF
ncbi:hypothetical protein ACIRPT_35410 [Streptomyces sp. NPDC101227]|uniref:hypothetical protein n=1 Tax=Streptomyces sp. NPDC101227 TaxID=3366136 RepID=UPI0037F7CF1D